MFIKENNEKSQIIKLIKQSRTDNELKSMLIDLVNLLVVDNIDISELKSVLRKTLSSNGTKLNSVLDVIEDTQDDNVLIKEFKVQPRTKEELKQIIEETIKEKGNNCDLNFIDTSLITDMRYMFRNSKFNGDISKWNVSNVKDMSQIFADSKFNGDISDWDVSNVETMSWMFYNSNFNSDIFKWNVSKVKNMSGMFMNSKFNGDISKWNVCKVDNMAEMFENSVFSRDISKWNIEFVNMIWMFNNCPLENKPEFQPQFKN